MIYSPILIPQYLLAINCCWCHRIFLPLPLFLWFRTVPDKLEFVSILLFLFFLSLRALVLFLSVFFCLYFFSGRSEAFWCINKSGTNLCNPPPPTLEFWWCECDAFLSCCKHYSTLFFVAGWNTYTHGKKGSFHTQELLAEGFVFKLALEWWIFEGYPITDWKGFTGGMWVWVWSAFDGGFSRGKWIVI